MSREQWGHGYWSGYSDGIKDKANGKKRPVPLNCLESAVIWAWTCKPRSSFIEISFLYGFFSQDFRDEKEFVSNLQKIINKRDTDDVGLSSDCEFLVYDQSFVDEAFNHYDAIVYYARGDK